MLKLKMFSSKHIRELEYEHNIREDKSFLSQPGKREYDIVGCVIENVMHMDDIGHVKR